VNIVQPATDSASSPGSPANGVDRLVSELLEAWNSHDVDRVASLYAQDYNGYDVGQASPQQGVPGIRRSVTNYFLAFPDLRFETESTLVQCNQVAIVWRAEGTHRGSLMHIPATGRRVDVRGVSLLTIEKGKVLRGHYIWDVAGLLRSLGLLPDLP
jgi:steroid delta-isomerase-like uncharacterized protein